MTLGQYLRLWWAEARAQPFSNSRLAGFLVSVIGGIISYALAPSAPAIQDALRITTWLVPLIVFALFLLPEIVSAPYRFHLKAIADADLALDKVTREREQARAQIQRLERELDDFSDKSRPTLVPVETASTDTFNHRQECAR